MSATKHSTTQSRRSPVGNRKSKTPGRAKSKPISNGLHEYIPESAQISRSASAGKFEVAQMNLNTVRILDSSVVKIKSTVPQVVVYQYESTSATWERTSVEGTLFVCERESSPRYGFVVLNKLHSENSMVTITPGIEFKVQDLFVLYKNEIESKVYGLCFEQAAVCKKIGNLLNRLSHSQEAVNNGHSPAIPRRSASAINFSTSKSDQKVNVMELFESANRNYLGQNFSDGASSPDSLTSEPIQFATTGASIAEHRSAQPRPIHQTTPVAPATHPVKVPGVRVTSRTNTVSPVKNSYTSRTDPSQPGQIPQAASFSNGFSFTPNSSRPSDHSRSFDHGSGIVRKLFSQGEQNDALSQSLNYPVSYSTPNSVPLRAVSLDEVEKQMTAEVTSPDANIIPYSLLHAKPSISSSDERLLLQPSMFVSTAAPSPIKAPSEPIPSQTQPSSISIQPPTPNTSQPLPLGRQEQSFPPVPPVMLSAGMKAPITKQNGKKSSGTLSSDSSHQTPSQTSGPPLRAVSEPISNSRNPITIQPSLSPLPELSTSQPRSTSPISSTLMSPHQFKGEPTDSTRPSSTIDKHSIVLNKEQLLQAFEYLLKNDEHFVDQLHDAYKQSLLSRQNQ